METDLQAGASATVFAADVSAVPRLDPCELLVLLDLVRYVVLVADVVVSSGLVFEVASVPTVLDWESPVDCSENSLSELLVVPCSG